MNAACACRRCTVEPDHLDAAIHRSAAACLALLGASDRRALIDGDTVDDAAIARITVAQEERVRSVRAQMAALVDIAADEPSRAVLAAQIDLVLRGDDPGDGESSVRVRCGEQVLEIAYPISGESLFILSEVLVTRIYAVHDAPPVDVIYDLGANIGITSVYLAASHPEARVVCVEPLESNLAFLRRNVTRFGDRVSVVPAAVGTRRGDVTLNVFTLHGTNSIVFESVAHQSGHPVTVPLVPLREVIAAGRYAIKIDIEGGEHLLAADSEPIEAARWVCGEVHYGPGLRPDTAGDFERMLARAFELEPSTHYFTMRCSQLVRTFRGVACGNGSRGR